MGVFALASGSAQCWGLVVFSSTPSLSLPDTTLTFDSLNVVGVDLSGYEENTISVTVADSLYVGFQAFFDNDPRTTGFHYGTSGNDSFITITPTTSTAFNGIEFLLGNGLTTQTTTTLIWETRLDGVVTGAGMETDLEKGGIYNISDTSGVFDEVRLAAHTNVISLGDFQSIAIDDLKIFATTAIVVPEPSVLAFAAVLSLGGIYLKRRRRIV